MFDTAAEAQQKLTTSVVLFDGSPTLIQEASGRGTGVTLTHHMFRTGKQEKTNIWDKRWDFKSVGSRLGYSNLSKDGYKEALYLTRIHVRKSHATQGISKSNLRIPPTKGNEKLGIQKQQLLWDSIYNNPAFWETLERKYPTIQGVITSLKDSSITSIAFDPKLAIRRHPVGPFYLEYRGKDVAFSDDLYRWKVGEDFLYLKETLEHNKLKVA